MSAMMISCYKALTGDIAGLCFKTTVAVDTYVLGLNPDQSSSTCLTSSRVGKPLIKDGSISKLRE